MNPISPTLPPDMQEVLGTVQPVLDGFAALTEMSVEDAADLTQWAMRIHFLQWLEKRPDVKQQRPYLRQVRSELREATRVMQQIKRQSQRMPDWMKKHLVDYVTEAA
ncbi:MAG: hypothetical protein IAE79_17620 [Anaerolinea sp.]|nr:hypothetical protein [Anaerolinea sp.]